MKQPLSVSARVLGWFTLVYGAIMVAGPLVGALLVWSTFSFPQLALLVLFGATHLVAAAAALQGRVRWFWVLYVLFLLQSIEYVSESIHLSLIGPMSVKFIWSLRSGKAFLGVNVLAIAFAVLAAVVAPKASAYPVGGGANAGT